MKATELILLKLQEDSAATYQNKSTSYTRQGAKLVSLGDMALPLGAETLSASSTITIAGTTPLYPPYQLK